MRQKISLLPMVRLREYVRMKSVLVSSVTVGACLVIFSPGVASAAANPAGTGQPGQTC